MDGSHQLLKNKLIIKSMSVIKKSNFMGLKIGMNGF